MYKLNEYFFAPSIIVLYFYVSFYVVIKNHQSESFLPNYFTAKPIKNNYNVFSFFNNDKPPYSVEKIAQGKLLDKAKEVSLSFFFEHWMQKKPRKAMVGCWFILHEDEHFIYWGKPYFKRIFSDKRVVEEFYKTDKNTITSSFSNYKTVDGTTVRIRLQEYIQQAQPEASYVTVSLGFKAQLENTTIIIQTNATIRSTKSIESNSNEQFQAVYKVVLDKNTLELIQLEKIN